MFFGNACAHAEIREQERVGKLCSATLINLAVKFTRDSPKPLYFAMRWRRKMEKTKKDTNVRVNGRRKQTKESAAE